MAKPKYFYDIDGITYSRLDIQSLLGITRQRISQLDKKGYLVGRVLMALDLKSCDATTTPFVAVPPTSEFPGNTA